MPPSFHVHNFGCRAARADGEAIAARLTAAGCQTTPLDRAEVVVVNTCSVTAEADRAARALIRRARRLNPAARIVVTGCYAQRAPRELAAIEGVAAVIGNSHKALAPQMILGLLHSAGQDGAADAVPSPAALLQIAPAPAVVADDRFAFSFFAEAQLAPRGSDSQTRPNLKIQEGCSNRCTYCVIPTTRGPSRSLSPEAILGQVRGFVAGGGNELVLSGINLGRWGMDLAGRPRLSALVERILAETALPRLRLSSVEPMDWDAALIEILRTQTSPRLARHAHLPLQSGSDAVLRRMHRRYRPWHYAQKVEQLFAACPQLTLGADVMVGFPGESEAEFQESVDFIGKLPFAYLHLFPFSPRPGTAGAELHRSHPVPARVVAERMQSLRALAAEKSSAHRRGFVGQSLPAITLKTPAAVTRRNRTSALSDNFIPVEIEGSVEANQMVELSLTGTIASAQEGVILIGEQRG